MGIEGHRLVLLRHGETEWSRSGRHTGRTELDLTETGRRQAVAAGETLASLQLDNPLVVCSPRRRAQVTAELAGLHLDEVSEDLAEWDYGDYEGLTTKQIRESVPEWTVWTHPSPAGETAEEVGARAAKVLERVRPARVAGDVILIGHGHFSRVLIATWLTLPPTSGVHFGLDAAGIATLGDERGVPQLRMLNLPPVPA